MAATDISLLFIGGADIEVVINAKTKKGQDENETCHHDHETDEEKDTEVKTEKIRNHYQRIPWNFYSRNTSKTSSYYNIRKFKAHIQDKTTPPPEIA